VQDISSFEHSVRLEELGGFFRDQRWRHMHDVVRSQGCYVLSTLVLIFSYMSRSIMINHNLLNFIE